MNIADDLACAFNDGYEKGKADAETYLLYCGDTDKPQTNADRIRAMTDEELADLVYDHSCAYCPMKDCDGRINIGRDACYKRWLDWLKQEVKNNE